MWSLPQSLVSPLHQPGYSARAYGLRWNSELPLRLFATAPTSDSPADVHVSVQGNADRAYIKKSGRLRICQDGIRYVADDDLVLDVYGGTRIAVSPNADWTGELPAPFYGTATAALLALSGMLVLHGSCVEMDGEAMLLCGRSGAGKSTLTAALIAAGGRLISDDLSAVARDAVSGRLVVSPGRRAVRLFPDLAEMLADAVPVQKLESDIERKLLVAPPFADAEKAYPLRTVILLGQTIKPGDRDATILLLLESSYRRAAFRHLPAHAARASVARTLIRDVPVVARPPVEARDRTSFHRLAASMIASLR